MDKKLLRITKEQCSALDSFLSSIDDRSLEIIKKKLNGCVSSRKKKQISSVFPSGTSAHSMKSPALSYNTIMNDDWFELYRSYDNSEPSCYVYAHVDPRFNKSISFSYEDGNKVSLSIPFYIGMGRGGRDMCKSRSLQHTKKITAILNDGFSFQSICVRLVYGITEMVARQIESKLILFWGCKFSSSSRLLAMYGGKPTLYNNKYEPYPDKYNLFGMAHSTI